MRGKVRSAQVGTTAVPRLSPVVEITLAVRVHHPDLTWVYFHRVVQWPAAPRVGDLLRVDYEDDPVELREISWDLEGRARIDLPPVEPESPRTRTRSSPGSTGPAGRPYPAGR